MAQRDQRGMTTVRASVFRLERLNLTVPRVRIDLPHGFEFRIAEMGSGTTKATAAIALPGIENTHIHFAHLHLSNKGVID